MKLTMEQAYNWVGRELTGCSVFTILAHKSLVKLETLQIVFPADACIQAKPRFLTECHAETVLTG